MDFLFKPVSLNCNLHKIIHPHFKCRAQWLLRSVYSQIPATAVKTLKYEMCILYIKLSCPPEVPLVPFADMWDSYPLRWFWCFSVSLGSCPRESAPYLDKEKGSHSRRVSSVIKVRRWVALCLAVVLAQWAGRMSMQRALDAWKLCWTLKARGKQCKERGIPSAHLAPLEDVSRPLNELLTPHRSLVEFLSRKRNVQDTVSSGTTFRNV